VLVGGFDMMRTFVDSLIIDGIRLVRIVYLLDAMGTVEQKREKRELNEFNRWVLDLVARNDPREGRAVRLVAGTDEQIV
jgi:hypothetical protein